MQTLLIEAQKLLKEEIKGKSSYYNFMNLIDPMYQHINQLITQCTKASRTHFSLNVFRLMSLKDRLDDIKFDVRSLKNEVSDNNGIIDFSNIDTYDDYAIEDIFKNTHILVETLKTLAK